MIVILKSSLSVFMEFLIIKLLKYYKSQNLFLKFQNLEVAYFGKGQGQGLLWNKYLANVKANIFFYFLIYRNFQEKGNGSGC